MCVDVCVFVCVCVCDIPCACIEMFVFSTWHLVPEFRVWEMWGSQAHSAMHGSVACVPSCAVQLAQVPQAGVGPSRQSDEAVEAGCLLFHVREPAPTTYWQNQRSCRDCCWSLCLVHDPLCRSVLNHMDSVLASDGICDIE